MKVSRSILAVLASVTVSSIAAAQTTVSMGVGQGGSPHEKNQPPPPAYPGAVRQRPGRRHRVLRDAVRGGRVPARPARAREAAADRRRVVLNWFEELKTKMER